MTFKKAHGLPLVVSALACFTCVAVSANAASNNKKDESKFAVQQAIEESRETLLSFDNSSLDTNNSITTFSCEHSNTNAAGQRRSFGSATTTTFYQAMSYSELGVISIDVGIKDNTGEVLGQTTVYGYPFTNDDGELDVELDLFGNVTTASDLLLGANPRDFDLDIGTGIRESLIQGHLLTDMAVISNNLATFSQAQTYAKSILDIPALDEDVTAIFDYLMYRFEVMLATSNYQHNKLLPNPTGLIEDQNDLSDWKFGFKTLDDNGCGIVSIFNLLYESGANPNLALLTALAEMGNVELLFAVFGPNPIDSDPSAIQHQIDIIMANINTDTFLTFLYGQIDDLAVRLALNVFDPSNPPWYCFGSKDLTQLAFDAVVAIISGGLKSLVPTGRVLLEILLPFLMRYRNGLGKILDVVLGEEYTYVQYTSYNAFRNNVLNHRQFIVCYWNEAGGSGLPNILEGAHFRYGTVNTSGVRKKYDMHNSNQTIASSARTYRIFEQENHTDAETTFIAAYIIKPVVVDLFDPKLPIIVRPGEK